MKSVKFYAFVAVVGFLMAVAAKADSTLPQVGRKGFAVARTGGLKSVPSGERSGYQRASRELEVRYTRLGAEIQPAVDRIIAWGSPGLVNRQVAVKADASN